MAPYVITKIVRIVKKLEILQFFGIDNVYVAAIGRNYILKDR